MLDMLNTQKQSPEVVKQWFIDNFKHPVIIQYLIKNNPAVKGDE